MAAQYLNWRVVYTRGGYLESDREGERSSYCDSDEYDEEEVPAKQVVGAVVPLNGVVRISLSVTPMINQERRENIFHIKFLVNEAICVAIIDYGSCTNVVAVTLIEKLQLPNTTHPLPYQLHWLKDKGFVHITK